MLISCKECDANVSDQARICPNCGFNFKNTERSLAGKLIKVIFIVFNCTMALWLIDFFNTIGDYGISPHSDKAMMGASVIVFFWIVISSVIGLILRLTNPKN